MEDAGILERLVFAFGDTEKHDFRVLAEVVARRANEVANVLDEQQAGPVEPEFLQMAIDHASIQVARAAGNNLAHGKTEAREAPGIVVGLQVAGQDSNAAAGQEGSQGSLKKCGLARARGTDDVDA